MSFGDLIGPQVAKDGIPIHDIFIDGLHPLDPGMKYIAQFITDELNRIYQQLPADKNIPAVNTELPLPLTTDLYANTTKYNAFTLTPVSNNGWTDSMEGWSADVPGAEIVFELEGDAIALEYSKHNEGKRGKVKIWIDNVKDTTLDAYWTETWGPATIFTLIGKNLSKGKHILHLKIIDDHSEGSTGHYFQLLNVLKAENNISPQKNSLFFGADNKNIQYTGRMDFSNPKLPKFWAPGAYFMARFRGPYCEILLNDEVKWGKSYNYLEVVIDGSKHKRIQTEGYYNVIKVADGLSDDEHTVLICKDTESKIGYLEFLGFRCKELLPLPPKPERKIEFIGNSITCGTGSDPSAVKCQTNQWYDQHNAYMSYGPLIARKLNAQWHLSSYSGIGLIHSCCDISMTMPDVYDKLYFEQESPAWDVKNYIPDVVTICLGQNDGIQDSTAFCSAYVKFIRKVREYYPEAPIICLTSPMADPNLTKALKQYLTGIVNYINAQGDHKVYKFFFSRSYNNGCDYHPDISQHQQIANELEPYLKKITGW